MNNLKFIIKSSRPRFWAYLFGPFLVGFFAALVNDSFSVFMDPWFWIFLIYFIFPANVLIYGVNDLSDADTDQYNEKKSKQEVRAEEGNIRLLKTSVFISLILSVVLLVNPVTRIWVILFIILGTFYSIPPIRLKARPFLDSLSNIFYIFPALIGFSLNGNIDFSIITWLVIFSWPVAMHLYSAIPDIIPDKKAGLTTTATVIGRKNSLLLCLVLWLGFSLSIIIKSYFTPWSYLLLIYPFIPLINIFISNFPEEKTYWYFPYINFIIGFSYSMLIISTLS